MNSKHSIESVKSFVNLFEGYNVLSTKYINNHSKLSFQCPNNHIFEMEFRCFQSGQRCPVCYGRQKLSFEYVKNYIESIDGYKLLSKEYVNNIQKLQIQCPVGHIFEMSYDSFRIGKRCSVCWKENKVSRGEKEILFYIESIYNDTIIHNDRSVIWNSKTNRYLELDIWLPNCKKAIEYDSIYFHKNRKYQDNLKDIQCKILGIKLLRINYEDWCKNKDFDKIDNFINSNQLILNAPGQ